MSSDEPFATTTTTTSTSHSTGETFCRSDDRFGDEPPDDAQPEDDLVRLLAEEVLRQQSIIDDIQQILARARGGRQGRRKGRTARHRGSGGPVRTGRWGV
jgi:hypothetical protein